MINDGRKDPDFFNPFQPIFRAKQMDSRELSSSSGLAAYELCRGKFMKVLMPEIIKVNCP